MGFLVNLGIGLLFGTGLVVGGMADPAKVLNFLDLFGTWDPSLAFVMAGAVAVTFVGFRAVLKRRAPLFDRNFHLPAGRGLDRRLVAGSALFGIGWGLAGFCPGPALTSLGLGSVQSLVFVPAMLAGMAVARHLAAPRTSARPHAHS